MTFIEVNYKHNEEELVELVRKEDIIGIKELATQPKRLYDEDGNLVSEEKSPRVFQVLVASDRNTKDTILVEEKEYNRLKDLLSK